jgi:hypothetical protein
MDLCQVFRTALSELIFCPVLNFESETARILQRFRRFAQGVFIEQVEPFVCDRCESRIACPYWVSALD